MCIFGFDFVSTTRNTLELFNAHGKVAKRYMIISPEKKKTFFLKVKLPQYISCSKCLFQWTYVAGNHFQFKLKLTLFLFKLYRVCNTIMHYT